MSLCHTLWFLRRDRGGGGGGGGDGGVHAGHVGASCAGQILSASRVKLSSTIRCGKAKQSRTLTVLLKGFCLFHAFFILFDFYFMTYICHTEIFQAFIKHQPKSLKSICLKEL